MVFPHSGTFTYVGGGRSQLTELFIRSADRFCEAARLAKERFGIHNVRRHSLLLLLVALPIILAVIFDRGVSIGWWPPTYGGPVVFYGYSPHGVLSTLVVLWWWRP